MPVDALRVGVPAVHAVTPFEAAVLEAILTFFLVWVVFASAADPRGTFKSVAGLAIGLCGLLLAGATFWLVSRRSLSGARRVLTWWPLRRFTETNAEVVAIEHADVDRDFRPLARRYLGPQAGDHYIETTRSEHGDNVLVRMRPERWLTVDYTKRHGHP